MYVVNKMCLHLRSISCAIVYKTRCVRVNLHSRMSGGFVAGVLYTEMRDVKTTQDNMKNQLQIDHDKVTQQLQTVTWQLDRVTEKLEKQKLYMDAWCTVFLGTMVFMMTCMTSSKQSHYSACYVPKQNVTDDVHYVTVQGHMVDGVQVLVNLLTYVSSFFVDSPSRE